MVRLANQIRHTPLRMGLRHNHFQAVALLATILVIFGSTFARAESADDDDLVKLARKHFNYDSIKSDQVRNVFDKFFLSVHQGNRAFFVRPGTKFDPSQGYSWGPEQTVESAWIVWVSTDPDAVKFVRPAGIQIYGAKIDGDLDLSWAKMQFQLAMDGCYFTGGF